MALKILKQYLTGNRCYQTGSTCAKIGIQIHSIGTGQGTAASVAEYWNQPTIAACVHYCVDADTAGKVLQFLPENIRSWADAGWGNDNLITIEICESDYMKYTSGANYAVSDVEKFKADILRGYSTAIELCAKICKERGWNPQEKLANGMYLISSHNEGNVAGLSSGHIDPDHVWSRCGLNMADFRLEVARKLEAEPEIVRGKKVELTTDIAIRDGVSTETKTAGYVKYEELTESVKLKCIKMTGGNAKLKKGNVVEIQAIQTDAQKNVWI
jgi:hypothetical protein